MGQQIFKWACRLGPTTNYYSQLRSYINQQQQLIQLQLLNWRIQLQICVCRFNNNTMFHQKKSYWWTWVSPNTEVKEKSISSAQEDQKQWRAYMSWTASNIRSSYSPRYKKLEWNMHCQSDLVPKITCKKKTKTDEDENDYSTFKDNFKDIENSSTIINQRQNKRKRVSCRNSEESLLLLKKRRNFKLKNCRQGPKSNNLSCASWLESR